MNYTLLPQVSIQGTRDQINAVVGQTYGLVVDEPAVGEFYIVAAPPDGVARVEYMTEGNLLFVCPGCTVPLSYRHGPLLCQRTGEEVTAGVVRAGPQFVGEDQLPEEVREWWRKYARVVRILEVASGRAWDIDVALDAALVCELNPRETRERLERRTFALASRDEIDTIKLWGDQCLSQVPQPTHYERTLVTLFRSGIVHPDQVGLLCSAVRHYRNRPEKKQAEAEGERIGTVGERVELRVRVTKISGPYPGDYGDSYLCAMETDTGEQVIWWTGENLALEEGQQYDIRGTVQAHGEYNGRKQTRLSRVVDLNKPKRRKTRGNAEEGGPADGDGRGDR